MELVNAWRYRPCQYPGQCKPRSQRDVIPPVQASRTLLAWSALLVWFSVTWGLFLGGLACWAFAGPLVCLSPNIFSPKAQVVPPPFPSSGGGQITQSQADSPTIPSFSVSSLSSSPRSQPGQRGCKDIFKQKISLHHLTSPWRSQGRLFITREIC